MEIGGMTNPIPSYTVPTLISRPLCRPGRIVPPYIVAPIAFARARGMTTPGC